MDLHFLLHKKSQVLTLGWCRLEPSGVEVELAQLRQEIATERAERQALARLVDSLIKVRQTVFISHFNNLGKSWFGMFGLLK